MLIVLAFSREISHGNIRRNIQVHEPRYSPVADRCCRRAGYQMRNVDILMDSAHKTQSTLKTYRRLSIAQASSQSVETAATRPAADCLDSTIFAEVHAALERSL